ncbi:uncharacterized protein EV422DRAFT_504021 [Fimicolochytrium jonesii]|uniref:uncharacterized protein n=1 Tax=Fimicolochytrium jonesii TaxID=1396493 RepID=UPI0022FEF7FC|nr:uncharacterized protein EV422DRAFT_504021 [Fimicolochytrium jonesii]KAI8825309.1 hypothetical protein EV422DRAFT_504021 [Fimicolochytrium jonesii]
MSNLLWVPRLMLRVLGPKRRSTGTDSFFSRSHPETTQQPAPSSTTIHHHHNYSTLNPLAGNPNPAADGLGRYGADSLPSQTNGEEYERLRRNFRAWLCVFVIVMCLCVVNIVVLDVMWAKKGGFGRSTNSTEVALQMMGSKSSPSSAKNATSSSPKFGGAIG